MASDKELKEVSVFVSDVVIFPHTVHRLSIPLDIEFNDQKVIIVFEKKHHFSPTGLLCEIIDDDQKMDDRFIVIEGIQRVNIHKRDKHTVVYSLCEPNLNITRDLLNLSNTVYTLFKDHHVLVESDDLSMDTLLSLTSPDQPHELADFISSYLPIKYSDKLNIIESIDVYHRLEQVKKYLNQSLIEKKMNQELDGIIQQNVDSERKEMMLKAKLRAIQEELNNYSQIDIINDYKEKLDAVGLNQDLHSQILFDIQRLEQCPDDSTEFAVIKTYLDTFFSLPWKKQKSSKINISRVKKELTDNHFGLELVKTRILEHLAIRKIAKKRIGAVLCLAGPPGVGKTSIVQSVAHALRRPYIRISLAGVRDEAELRGHRRTYVGAMPGKIIASLIKADAINPVICLDEIDKLFGGFKGDPSAALLEILDVEQNTAFMDHYLQCPFDLSQCMFVCTANDLNQIPEPLLNRLEVIRIPGYTISDKVTVATDYLLPRICNELGVPKDFLNISSELWSYIINQYISDVGLRELRQVINRLCRKVALKIVTNKNNSNKWTKKTVIEMLGEGRPKPSFSVDPLIGRSVGLMLQSMVGYCCPIETQVYEGTPGFTATGNLDQKLDEAIRIVFGLLKTRHHDFNIDTKKLFESHFHVHFQNTALYKTGSGWELGILASIMSELLDIPLPGTVTFSGQLSLSGKILPVGGVSQKLLAGSHIGIKSLVVSSMEVVPPSDKYSTTLIPITTIDDLMGLLIKHKQ